MSFSPFDFTFTPPRTVPSQVPASTATSIISNDAINSQTQAGKLITQLNDLTAMSRYLQDAIVARTGRTAVEIDPAIDPDTNRALASIYSTDTPPKFVTISMYNQLLDANLGALQLEMSLNNNVSVQTNPIQVGDLLRALNTIEDHLINVPSYNNWLPLQLPTLKGDAILFQSWVDALKTYPAYYTSKIVSPTDFKPNAIRAADLDISPDLAEYENSTLNRYAVSYSVLYQSMAGTSSVEGDIQSVINEFFMQSPQNVVLINSLIGSLRGLIHKQDMNELKNDVVNYSLIRLGSDAVSTLHMADQLVSLSIAPLRGKLGALGSIVNSIQGKSITVGTVLGGSLSGISNTSSCAQVNPGNKITISASAPLNVPGLGVISAGLQSLGEHLDWAQREIQGHLALVDKSFRQMIERRLSQQDNQNSLMCSLRSLTAILAIGEAVAAEFQKGTVSPSSSQTQIHDSINRILTSLQTGSSTTFTTAGNQVIVNPPDMPPVPDSVRNVLSKAKIRTTLGRIQT